MKVITYIIFTISFILSSQASERCSINVSGTIVKSEAMVPSWNPKKNKTMLMRTSFKQFTSPFPDLVQLHIPFEGECSKLKIKLVKIYRQIGPRDWINDKKSSIESDHGSHKKNNSVLRWEKKPNKEFTTKFKVQNNFVVLENIPVEAPLTAQKENEHIWSLKYEIEYMDADKVKSSTFLIESPLIH